MCVCVRDHVCDRVSTDPNCGPGVPNAHHDVRQCDISATYGQVACPCMIVCCVNLSRLAFFFQKHLALPSQVHSVVVCFGAIVGAFLCVFVCD